MRNSGQSFGSASHVPDRRDSTANAAPPLPHSDEPTRSDVVNILNKTQEKIETTKDELIRLSQLLSEHFSHLRDEKHYDLHVGRHEFLGPQRYKPGTEKYEKLNQFISALQNDRITLKSRGPTPKLQAPFDHESLQAKLLDLKGCYEVCNKALPELHICLSTDADETLSTPRLCRSSPGKQPQSTPHSSPVKPSQSIERSPAKPTRRSLTHSSPEKPPHCITKTQEFVTTHKLMETYERLLRTLGDCNADIIKAETAFADIIKAEIALQTINSKEKAKPHQLQDPPQPQDPSQPTNWFALLETMDDKFAKKVKKCLTEMTIEHIHILLHGVLRDYAPHVNVAFWRAVTSHHLNEAKTLIVAVQAAFGSLDNRPSRADYLTQVFTLVQTEYNKLLPSTPTSTPDNAKTANAKITAESKSGYATALKKVLYAIEYFFKILGMVRPDPAHPAPTRLSPDPQSDAETVRSGSCSAPGAFASGH